MTTTSFRTGRTLRLLERVGNRLPHPFYLFLIVAALVVVGSAIAWAFGATAIDPSSGERVPVRSLLSAEGLAYMVTSAIPNFVAFPPLGLILTVMLGIGLAERVGLMEALMRRSVASAPPRLTTFVIVVVCLLSNLASDSALLVLPPLAAAAFLAAGRHPLAGFATAYTAVAAGFSANVVIAGTDVLMSGISTQAARIVDPDLHVSPLANWFFMSASTLVLAVVITVVCHLVVEPRLGHYVGAVADAPPEPITAEQRRGLRRSGVVAAVFVTVLALAVVVPGSPLRGEDGDLLRSPFLEGLPLFILLFFVAVAIAYGRGAGTLSSWGEVPVTMAGPVRDLAPFIVVIFAAAQAIAYFNWTGIGLVVATGGAELLETLHLDGIWGLLLFSILVAVPALVIGSGSALWALIAPIAIPMFAVTGIDPAYVQAGFRLTDSATNPLVPMNPMLPVMLGMIQRYQPRAGLGTFFSLVLPFTLAVWGTWLLLFLVWGLLGLPVGPGHGLLL
ncbi:aminobenzoyl-glutamate transport protein [Microbacterium resistens]|uniref:Aminobenzoyl-glutamate transport protein n=1 Tax=Microbacterium resistens TaxID=156977 RepID=A0ABU1S7S1_9MICO|nr:AbgT family transporter [Microbacterium resistens]MDR6865662.1 aminobenzoyl-glutamate transport protein [Microbacterium resistens]